MNRREKQIGVTRRPLVRGRFLVCAVIALALYLECPFRLSVVWGDSMAPTYQPGTVCLLDRGYYLRQPMKNGDVVVAQIGEQVLTKRVYGAPGETLLLLQYPEDGTYEIPPPRLLKQMRPLRGKWPYPVQLVRLTIPPGKCFLVGDNRDASYDSRSFGLVDTEKVMGKMVATVRQEAIRQLGK
jgi:signal peptidase I